MISEKSHTEDGYWNFGKSCMQTDEIEGSVSGGVIFSAREHGSKVALLGTLFLTCVYVLRIVACMELWQCTPRYRRLTMPSFLESVFLLSRVRDTIRAQGELIVCCR